MIRLLLGFAETSAVASSDGVSPAVISPEPEAVAGANTPSTLNVEADWAAEPLVVITLALFRAVHPVRMFWRCSAVPVAVPVREAAVSETNDTHDVETSSTFIREVCWAVGTGAGLLRRLFQRCYYFPERPP